MDRLLQTTMPWFPGQTPRTKKSKTSSKELPSCPKITLFPNCYITNPISHHSCYGKDELVFPHLLYFWIKFSSNSLKMLGGSRCGCHFVKWNWFQIHWLHCNQGHICGVWRKVHPSGRICCNWIQPQSNGIYSWNWGSFAAPAFSDRCLQDDQPCCCRSSNPKCPAEKCWGHTSRPAGTVTNHRIIT